MTLIASILVLTALTGSAALAAVTDQGAAGAELIGTEAPSWEGAEWLTTEPLRLEDLRGKVVLVRWWTDTCPYCSRSAPALNEFHARYAQRGLIVIGMYHPKPIDRPITASEIREAAQERGSASRSRSTATGLFYGTGGSTADAAAQPRWREDTVRATIPV